MTGVDYIWPQQVRRMCSRCYRIFYRADRSSDICVACQNWIDEIASVERVIEKQRARGELGEHFRIDPWARNGCIVDGTTYGSCEATTRDLLVDDDAYSLSRVVDVDCSEIDEFLALRGRVFRLCTERSEGAGLRVNGNDLIEQEGLRPFWLVR